MLLCCLVRLQSALVTQKMGGFVNAASFAGSVVMNFGSFRAPFTTLKFNRDTNEIVDDGVNDDENRGKSSA